MADKPKFDPNKPFKAIEESKPAFDPNKPYVDAALKKKEPTVSESPSPDGTSPSQSQPDYVNQADMLDPLEVSRRYGRDIVTSKVRDNERSLNAPSPSSSPLPQDAIGASLSGTDMAQTVPPQSPQTSTAQTQEGGVEPQTDYFFKGNFGGMLRAMDAASPIPLGGIIDEIGRTWASGQVSNEAVDESLALMMNPKGRSDQDLQAYVDAVKLSQSMPPSKAMQNFNRIYEQEGSDFWAFAKAIVQNPKVAPEVMLSSISAMFNAPSLAAAGGVVGTAAAGGAVLGGGVGAIPAVIGSLPYAMAAAGTVLETATSFTEFLQEELSKEGKEFTKENIKAILEDEDKMNVIRAKAAGRGIIIGAVDAFGSKLSGSIGAKFISRGTRAGAVKGTLAGTGIEAASGSGGEAAARAATGQRMDAAEIGLEGIGEMVQTPVSILSDLGQKDMKAAIRELDANKTAKENAAKVVGQPIYKINGETVTKDDILNIVSAAESAESIAGAKFDIANDPEMSAAVNDHMNFLAIKDNLKKAYPDYSQETINELTVLERDLIKISQDQTESAKIKRSSIQSAISDIHDKQNPAPEPKAAPQQPQAEAQPTGDVDQQQQATMLEKLKALRREPEQTPVAEPVTEPMAEVVPESPALTTEPLTTEPPVKTEPAPEVKPQEAAPQPQPEAVKVEPEQPKAGSENKAKAQKLSDDIALTNKGGISDYEFTNAIKKANELRDKAASLAMNDPNRYDLKDQADKIESEATSKVAPFQKIVETTDDMLNVKSKKESESKCRELSKRHQKKYGGEYTEVNVTNQDGSVVKHAVVMHDNYIYEPQSNSLIKKEVFNDFFNINPPKSDGTGSDKVTTPKTPTNEKETQEGQGLLSTPEEKAPAVEVKTETAGKSLPLPEELTTPVERSTTPRVDDKVMVKGRNGNPDFNANFRGLTNGGKEAVVVRERGMQMSVPIEDVTLVGEGRVVKGDPENIKYGVDEGLYQQAIKDGYITPQDAITIIESAGLEVPKDIRDMVKTPANKVEGEGVDYPHPLLKQIDKSIISEGKDLRDVENIILSLSGDHNKKARQELMSALTGTKVPAAKAGVTALDAEIRKWIKKNYPDANTTDRFKPVRSKKSNADPIERVPVIGIGDLHGENPKELSAQFERDGITKDGKWNTDNTVVQMGDVTDRGQFAGDLIDFLNNTAQKAKGKLVRILGNHDLFHVMGKPEQVGGKKDEMIAAKLWEGVLDGTIVAAWTEGDVIYTHAGISLDFFDNFVGMKPKDIVANLNERLQYAVKRNNFNDPIFDTENGIFWTRGDIENDQFRQVVGHTVKSRQHTYKNGDRVKYIDTGRVFGGDKKFFENTVASQGKPESPQALIDEINTKKLTHVKNLNLGSSEAAGTYLSTEAKNPYAVRRNGNSGKYDPTLENNATVTIKNPYLVKNNFEFFDLSNQHLDAARKKFIKDHPEYASDKEFMSAKTFDADAFEGITGFDEYIGREVTETFRKKGYDSIYLRETETDQGTLIVFDRENVKLEEKEPPLTKEQLQERHNRLVQMVSSYNNSDKNSRKKTGTAKISQLASQLGYSVKGGFDGKIIVEKEGKPIKKWNTARTKEELEQHKSLTDYSQDFQDFVDEATAGLKSLAQLDISMSAEERARAITDLQNGKKSAVANDVLDKLEGMFQVGRMDIIEGAGGSAVRTSIPIDEIINRRKEVAKEVQEITKNELPSQFDSILEDLGIDPEKATFAEMLAMVEANKGMFEGFPFNEKDYNDIKTFLTNAEKEANTQRDSGTKVSEDKGSKPPAGKLEQALNDKIERIDEQIARIEKDKKKEADRVAKENANPEFNLEVANKGELIGAEKANIKGNVQDFDGQIRKLKEEKAYLESTRQSTIDADNAQGDLFAVDNKADQSPIQESVSRFGWKAEPTDKGYDLYNSKGKKVVTIEVKGGKYAMTDQAGSKLLSGNKDIAKAAEGLIRDYYYGKEVAPKVETPKQPAQKQRIEFERNDEKIKKELADIDDLLKELGKPDLTMGGLSKIDKLTELVAKLVKVGYYKIEDIGKFLIEKGYNDLLPQLKEAYIKFKDESDLSLEVKTSLSNGKEINEYNPTGSAKATPEKLETGTDVQGRPIAIGTTGGTGGRRPPIRIADEADLPTPSKEHIVEGKYDIDEHQRFAANLAIDRYESGGKSFLLADGAGVGKTREILAIANERKLKGGKVLIVSLGNVIEANYRKDAKAMGIKLSDFEVGTYTDLVAGKIGKGEYDLAIYDESQNLKNTLSQRSITQAKVNSKHNLFASATPMDKVEHAVYFMSEITGKPQKDVESMLGIEIRWVKDKDGELRPWATTSLGVDHYLDKLIELRNGAIKQGSMIRRDYPFYGEIENKQVGMPGELQKEVVRVESIHQERIDNATNIAIMRLVNERLGGGRQFGGEMGQFKSDLANNMQSKGMFDEIKKDYEDGKMNKNYWDAKAAIEKFVKDERFKMLANIDKLNESAKVDEVYQRAKNELQNGKQVIIVGNYVNDHTVKAGTPNSKYGYYEKKIAADETFLAGIEKKLKADGYKIAKIFGGNKNKSYSVEQDKFQSKEAQVLLMTSKSGGTGIDLDDTVGNSPRKMIVATGEYAGDTFEQLLGRVSRRNTQSPAGVEIMYYDNNVSDANRLRRSEEKQKVIRSIVSGYGDLDAGRLASEKEGIFGDEAPQQPQQPKQEKAPVDKTPFIEERGNGIIVKNSFEIKDQLKAAGGKFVKDMGGWLFPKTSKEKVEKIISDRSLADKAIDFLDGLKVDTKGKAFDATLGIPIVLWNGSIDVIKASIKAGKAVADAITDAIDYIKKSHPNFDEARYRAFYEDAFTKQKQKQEDEFRKTVAATLQKQFEDIEVQFFGSKTATDADFKSPKGFFKRVPGFIVRSQEATIGKATDALSDGIATLAGKAVEAKNQPLRVLGKAMNSLFQNITRSISDVARKERFIGESKDRNIADAVTINKKLREIIDNSPESLRRIDQVIDPDFYRERTRDEFEQMISSRPRFEKLKPEDIDLMYEEYRKAMGFDEPGYELITYDKLAPNERAVADAITTIYDFIHDTNFVIGKIKMDTYIQNKGKYSARLYDTFEFPQEINEAFGVGTKMQTGMYKEKDTDLDAWKLQHKIDDPVHSVTKRLFQTMLNKGVADYSKWILTHKPSWTSLEERPGYTKLGSGYGDLSNKFVRDDIAEDFKGFFFTTKTLQSIYDGIKGYSRWNPEKWYLKPVSRQFYRKLFTEYNPAVQVGNLTGNIVFSAWLGVSPLRFSTNFVKAVGHVKDYSSTYRYLLSKGILNSDLTRADLINGRETYDKMLEEASKAKNPFKAVAKLPEKIYKINDDLAKIAAFESLIQIGIKPEKALNRIADSFQNFKRVGKAYDVFSQVPVFGSMFGRWGGDLARIAKSGITRRPLQLAAFGATLHLMAYLASSLSGETDEEKKIREQRVGAPKIPMPDFLGGDIPLTWKLGNDELNIARFVSPLYLYSTPDQDDVYELFQKFSPVPVNWPERTSNPGGRWAAILGSNVRDPVLAPLAQLLFNSDFKGAPVIDPAENIYKQSQLTSSEKIVNSLRFLGRGYIPYGTYVDDIVRAMMGQQDYYGRDRSVAQIMKRFLGWNTQQFGNERYKRVIENEFMQIQLRHDKNIAVLKDIHKAYSEGKISPEVARKRIAVRLEIETQIAKDLARLREKGKPFIDPEKVEIEN